MKYKGSKYKAKQRNGKVFGRRANTVGSIAKRRELRNANQEQSENVE